MASDRAATAPARPGVVDVTPGLLDMRRLDPAAPIPAGGLREVRLSVTADGITLGAVGMALAEALGVGVAVDEELVGVRVAVSLRDVNVGRLLDLLWDLYDALPMLEGDSRILLVSQRRMMRPNGRPRLPGEPFPVVALLETRLVPVPDGATAEQVAATFCHIVASRRGRASALGQWVAVTDQIESLERLEALIAAPPRRHR